MLAWNQESALLQIVLFLYLHFGDGTPALPAAVNPLPRTPPSNGIKDNSGSNLSGNFFLLFNVYAMESPLKWRMKISILEAQSVFILPLCHSLHTNKT